MHSQRGLFVIQIRFNEGFARYISDAKFLFKQIQVMLICHLQNDERAVAVVPSVNLWVISVLQQQICQRVTGLNRLLRTGEIRTNQYVQLQRLNHCFSPSLISQWFRRETASLR
jgi:hypothetical protein